MTNPIGANTWRSKLRHVLAPIPPNLSRRRRGTTADLTSAGTANPTIQRLSEPVFLPPGGRELAPDDVCHSSSTDPYDRRPPFRGRAKHLAADLDEKYKQQRESHPSI